MSDPDAGLFTDLYQLTMLQAYRAEGMSAPAVFHLYARRLPPQRNFLLACGLDDALRDLEALAFGADALAFLRSLGSFTEPFLDWLGGLQFSGDVWAVPEGTPVFAEEPWLEVVAPLPEAQLVETALVNRMQLQTLLASKAARVVHAAAGRRVVDFGLRRTHGTDAGLRAARAFHVAGVDATSNVQAGQVYGIPLAGTMAHSFVQAHDSEAEAFRAFARLYPETVLLVDTYDTEGGVRRVIDLARELGDAFRVRAIRLDSGDLAEQSRRARRLLDAAGLERVEIFASGSLDEWRVAELVQGGAPIDGFGVGTRMGVSDDAPFIDCVYKLVEYRGRGRLKLSADKRVRPGRVQVVRAEEDGVAIGDVIARPDESPPGRPLLVQVMQGGRRLEAGRADLAAARARAAAELAALPERLRALAPADPPYPVEPSATVARETQQLADRLARGEPRARVRPQE